MELTTALKSGLAVVSALEGVVIAVNLFSLMGFLFSAHFILLFLLLSGRPVRGAKECKSFEELGEGWK